MGQDLSGSLQNRVLSPLLWEAEVGGTGREPWEVEAFYNETISLFYLIGDSQTFDRLINLGGGSIYHTVIGSFCFNFILSHFFLLFVLV